MSSPSFFSSLREASMSLKILQASSSDCFPLSSLLGFLVPFVLAQGQPHQSLFPRRFLLVSEGLTFKRFLRFMDLSSSSEDDESESTSTLLSSLLSDLSLTRF